MLTKLQFSADLLTLTKESSKAKLHFCAVSVAKDDFVMKFKPNTQQNNLNIMRSKYLENDVEMVIYNVRFNFSNFNKYGTLGNSDSSRVW